MQHPFFRVQLRTVDVDRARSFYDLVLGGQAYVAIPLHEQALARGAQPHWLGFISVEDVDRSLARFVACGATPLGPTWRNAEGLEAVTLRDPGGAVLALGKQPRDATSVAPSPDVSFHVLNTVDAERARRQYADLFGWDFREPVEMAEHGLFYPFGWDAESAAVGALGDIAGRPSVHPHWLFHFRVASLADTLTTVRDLGGMVAGELELADGARLAVCDDPQGAAFALKQD